MEHDTKGRKISNIIFETVSTLEKDVFLGTTIADLLPMIDRKSVSAHICTLVKNGLLFRTGNRESGSVEYTRCSSMAQISDRTPNRGHDDPLFPYSDKDNAAIEKIWESRYNELEPLVLRIKSKNQELKRENSKLRKIIPSLPADILADLVLAK